VLITVIFFRWASRENADGRRHAREPSTLTWDQVAQELEHHPTPTP
jgi:hypothetical protein